MLAYMGFFLYLCAQIDVNFLLYGKCCEISSWSTEFRSTEK